MSVEGSLVCEYTIFNIVAGKNKHPIQKYPLRDFTFPQGTRSLGYFSFAIFQSYLDVWSLQGAIDAYLDLWDNNIGHSQSL